jgi:2-oxoglutarate ferredoxin oxidoreductase subunit beta
MGCLSTTTPYGSAEPSFDLCELAIAAGANYVARWTSYHVKELERAVKAGLDTPGFSFVEAMTQCPTNFGRRNKFKQVADQVEYLKTHALLKAKRDRMIGQGEKVPDDAFVVGELMRRSRPAMGVKE